jgi:hypothetical protein
MSGCVQILPGTGRWQRVALTKGGFLAAQRLWKAPSTTSLRLAVPLPVPGRSA